jgi:hypothetical protein
MGYVFLGTINAEIYERFEGFEDKIDYVAMIALFPVVWILLILIGIGFGPFKLAKFITNPKNWKFKIKVERNG